VDSTISRPKKILVAFTNATLLGEFRIDPASRSKPRADIAESNRLRTRSLQTAWVDRSLAEKPKVGELQMDWLRSEDLKEEKNVASPRIIIAV
jgi:hypothetical protein